MANETIADKLLIRISNQQPHNICNPLEVLDSVEGRRLVVQNHIGILPDMRKVADWSTSGSGLWGRLELDILRTPSSRELCDIILPLDPWALVGSVSELLMHGEEDRAKNVARTITELNPDRRQILESYFGQEITSDLLETWTRSS